MSKPSAEEKLLKILEKSQASSPAAAAAPSAAATSSKKKRFNIGLKQINPILIVLVICSVFFLVYQIQQGVQLLQMDVVVEADNQFVSSEAVSTVPRANSVEFYLSQFERRNIFTPYKQTASVAGQSTSSEGLAIRMAKYKLVGVAWLDLPESASVMLEDSESGLTHFLREGEKIEDVTVKTIYVDRVVFSYENEEIVFKL